MLRTKVCAIAELVFHVGFIMAGNENHVKTYLVTTHENAYMYTYLFTYAAEPFLRSCQLCSHSRTSQHFMESEISLPCSQEPSTGPYPKTDRSSPYRHFLSVRSFIQGICPGPRLLINFYNKHIFTPNPQAGCRPLVCSPRLLIQYIRSYPPYLEVVSSIRNLRTRHAMATRDPHNIAHMYTHIPILRLV
jgi:hypothetical protein